MLLICKEKIGTGVTLNDRLVSMTRYEKLNKIEYLSQCGSWESYS